MKSGLVKPAIMAAVVTIMAIIFALSLTARIAKRPLFIGSYSLFVVSSGSMYPAFSRGDLVVIKKTKIAEVREGDTIVFRAAALNGGLAFHRIVRISGEGIYVKGDNNAQEDRQIINAESLVGRHSVHIAGAGKYFLAVNSPVGFMLYLVAPICLLAIIAAAVKKVRVNLR